MGLGVVSTEFLGVVLLSIACEWAPSLYAPRERDNAPPFGLHGTMTAVSNKIPNLSIESFCESKSLAYGEYVDWRMSWTDHGDLEAFSLGFAGASALPPRVVPHPMLVPAPVEGREGRASSGTRATA